MLSISFFIIFFSCKNELSKSLLCKICRRKSFPFYWEFSLKIKDVYQAVITAFNLLIWCVSVCIVNVSLPTMQFSLSSCRLNHLPCFQCMFSCMWIFICFSSWKFKVINFLYLIHIPGANDDEEDEGDRIFLHSWS